MLPLPRIAVPEEAAAESPPEIAAVDRTVAVTVREDQFAAFYARTSRPLATYVQRLVGDPDTARDIAQDAYLRWLRAERPEMDERAATAYLYKIATRLIYDCWRRRQREERWQLLAPRDATPARPPDGLSSDLAEVLDRLKPRERALLWLAYVDEYTHEEIAEILDLKARSIRVLLSRARKRMVKVLRERGLTEEDRIR